MKSGETSLFEFMLALRKDPDAVLRMHFPDLPKGAEAPRNISRELKGTSEELTSFLIAYGFGDTLSEIVAIAFHSGHIDVSKEPDWGPDFDRLVKVYGILPKVMLLASEGEGDLPEKIELTKRHTPQREDTNESSTKDL